MSGVISACLITAVSTAGATAATYLDRTRTPLTARIAIGACIAVPVLAIVSLVLASLWGLTPATVAVATAICAAPLLVFISGRARRQLGEEAAAASRAVWSAVAGENRSGAIGFVLFALLGVFLVCTFRQAMIETGEGIQTRSLANRLDLTLHIGIIASFAWGGNFPPVHPEYAGAPLTYPFLIDLAAAAFARVGATIGQALLLQNVILILAIVVVIYHWALALTSSRTAAMASPLLVLFGSGLGWTVMLKDARQAGGRLVDFVMHLPHSYTLNTANLQWGNLTTIMLVPQRSLELGLPLVLIVTMLWWRALASESPRLMVLAGVVAGLLPLSHTHGFLVSMAAAGGLALLFPKWRLWIPFFAIAALIALPQILWVSWNSPIRAERFVQWEPGWAKGPEPLLWFWFKNTGLFIPLLVAALAAPREWIPRELRRFYLPALLFFIVPNLFRVAPRTWDSNKVLIFWYVASVPLVALLLARLGRYGVAARLCAAGVVLSLVLAGVLDAWRVASGAVTVTVFDRSAVDFANLVRDRTRPDALILRAPTADHPVLLTGRRSVLGYSARVRLHGLDERERESHVKCIYEGCAEARALLRDYGVDYVVVGPAERRGAVVNERFFAEFPVEAVSGEHRLYRVRDVPRLARWTPPRPGSPRGKSSALSGPAGPRP